MSGKKYVLSCLGGTLVLLMACALVIAYVDPFLQYHQPNPKYSYVLETDLFAYTNPGIAKHYDYDTVIMGSSMSRSFLPSHIDEQFDARTVKLSMAEARGRDLRDMLTVVEKNPKLKRVIIGLDAFAFDVDKNKTSYDKPMYLYDEYLWNDLPYVFSMDNLLRCHEVLSNTAQGVPSTTMDDYQNYAVTCTFGRQAPLGIFQREYTGERSEALNTQEERDNIIESLQVNLLPFLERNPEVEFLFYYPPYSVARWGVDQAPFKKLETMKIMAETLLPYDNAKLYFYQGDTQVITDLDHYMDSIHFDSEVANDIVDSMAQGEHLLTEENYQEVFSAFQDFIASYDYEGELKQPS